MASMFGLQRPVKPRVFVSYHHARDQAYYDALSSNMNSPYTFCQDNSLDRMIDSNSSDYVIRKIREDYISGTSCTVVLCGIETPWRKYVDWEIDATLQKQHALLGIKLPSLTVIDNGCSKPARLQDNIDSGYAHWVWWEDIVASPNAFDAAVIKARNRSKFLIKNDRERRLRNG
jgi:MTH538 TIR-like domain (DUF1863)